MRVLTSALMGIAVSFHTLVPAQNAARPNYDSSEMTAARAAIKKGAGGHTYYFVQGDRLEYH